MRTYRDGAVFLWTASCKMYTLMGRLFVVGQSGVVTEIVCPDDVSACVRVFE